MMQKLSPIGARNYHVIIKPAGASCNLQCAYCFYRSKTSLYPNQNLQMSEEVLECFTRQYIQSQNKSEITFTWQGGEPTLMGIDFFRKALLLQKKYCPPGVNISNSLQTNGTLLTGEWGSFLHQYNFLVGISVDGPAELHDQYRKDKNHSGSFDRVKRGVQILRNHKVEYNILACVHPGNQDKPLEVYKYFRDELKAQFIQFIPIVIPKNKTLSVNPVKFGNFMTAVFKEWLLHDIGNIFVQQFDVILSAWMKQPGVVCVHSPICDASIVVEFNGDVYCCDHFVDPQYLLGNIMNTGLSSLVNSDQYRVFQNRKSDTLTDTCKQCPYLFACFGECPKNRFDLAKRESESMHSPYLCEGYRTFFEKTAPYFRRMVEKLLQHRAPSEIMGEVKNEKLSL
jgi:uncharacterized protein